MWIKLASWLRDFLFGTDPEPQPEPIPEYNLREDWEFTGEKPSNDVIHQFNKGLEAIGDHIMYRSQDTGRFAGSVVKGENKWMAKELTLWIAGAQLLPGHTYLNAKPTCGVQRCVRPGHLKVKYAPSKPQTVPKAAPKLQIDKVQGRAVPVPEPKRRLVGMTKNQLLSGDRTKCASAKVFFEKLEEARDVATHYNNNFRNPGQQRLYGYDCDWCAGAHLTHQNPKKHNYKPKGSWA